MNLEQENTESKSKECFKCEHFTRYYTRGLYRYSITKQGFCTKQQKIVASRNSCDSWHSNYRRLSTSKRTCMKVLSELLLNIADIRQLFQEEKDENEND